MPASKIMTATPEQPATPASGADRQGQGQRAATPPADACPLTAGLNPPRLKVGLLTGGMDKHYSIGLALALVAEGVSVDFIGSDFVDGPELHNTPLVNFLNLRGDQREHVAIGRKILRLLTYYWRLVRYAAVTPTTLFHIQWNNKFEVFDRTLLMWYYRWLGKKIVFTAHNVNAGQRDACDTWLNRWTLKIQYGLCDHILVHTARMKDELVTEFGVRADRVTVIPYGINNAIPATRITASEAKQRLGVPPREKTILFFGHIAPYKGLDYLVAALGEHIREREEFRLIIAGVVKKGHEDYWANIQRIISRWGIKERIIEKIEHIPDAEVELYFKAADVLAMPYTHIFQSGVLFLAYSFGLPVIATDVGSLKEDVIEGKTGLVCRPQDPVALAKCLETYFSSELYQQLAARRQDIQAYANERHSWARSAAITTKVYSELRKADA